MHTPIQACAPSRPSEAHGRRKTPILASLRQRYETTSTLGQLGGFPPFLSAGFRQERVEFSAVEPMAPGGRCREAHGMTARALIYLID